MSFGVGWKQDWSGWEGEMVDGQFPLDRLLTQDNGGATFRTRFASATASILIAPIDATGAFAKGWTGAAALDHPHIVKVFRAGEWTRDGVRLGYAVTEYADENLGSVLRERPLAPEEVGEMIAPVLDALGYVQGRGLRLAGLTPSNLVAVEDVLKISTGVLAGADRSADLRAFADTVAEALTQTRDSSAPLPEPFRELCRKCVSSNPPAPAELAAWFRAPSGVRGESKAIEDSGPPSAKSRKNVFAIGGIAAIACVALGIWLAQKHEASVAVTPQATPQAAPAIAPQTAPAATAPAPAATVESAPAAPKHKDRAPRAGHLAEAAPGKVIHRVMPEIPAKARRTIRGTATIVVNVVVNPSGDVTQASPDRGSRYFGRLAAEAARKWRFAPSDGRGNRDYSLRFEITRDEMSAAVESR